MGQMFISRGLKILAHMLINLKPHLWVETRKPSLVNGVSIAG